MALSKKRGWKDDSKCWLVFSCLRKSTSCMYVCESLTDKVRNLCGYSHIAVLDCAMKIFANHCWSYVAEKRVDGEILNIFFAKSLLAVDESLIDYTGPYLNLNSLLILTTSGHLLRILNFRVEVMKKWDQDDENWKDLYWLSFQYFNTGNVKFEGYIVIEW